MHILNRIHAWFDALHRDEHGGANILVIIGLMFALLLVTPFFLNAGSLAMTRRSSQNGSDAASLAAAEWYAERLTYTPGKPGHYSMYRIPDQECLLDITPDIVLRQHSINLYRLQQYNQVVGSFRYAPFAAFGEAQRLAQQNRTEVMPDKYLPDICRGACDHRGAFQALSVSLITRRPVVAAVPSYFGDNNLPIRARSTATLYLANMSFGPREVCWGHIPPFVVINYEIHYFVRYPLDVLWLINLKEYQGLPYPND